MSSFNELLEKLDENVIHYDEHDLSQLEAENEKYYNEGNKPPAEVVNGGEAIVSFLKKLRIGADLAGSLAPVFSLKHYSFLEWLARLFQPRPFMMKIAGTSSEEKRMLIMVKYATEAMSTMIQDGVQEIKPYNPILGEVFECNFFSDDDFTEFKSEQVSHHPPISTALFVNKKRGFNCEITVQPKVKLQAQINVVKGPIVNSQLEGLQLFRIPSLGETYEISYPHFVCRNLLFGGTFTELNSDLVIQCKKTGLKAVVTYKSKSKHQCVGYITKGKTKLYKLQGTSNDKIVSSKLGDKKEKASILSNVSNMKLEAPTVIPVHQQQVHESRRVWHNVTKYIFEGNLEEANNEKSIVENNQRAITKKRKEMGIDWQPRNFKIQTKDGKQISLGPKTPYYRHGKYAQLTK